MKEIVEGEREGWERVIDWIKKMDCEKGGCVYENKVGRQKSLEDEERQDGVKKVNELNP